MNKADDVDCWRALLYIITNKRTRFCKICEFHNNARNVQVFWDAVASQLASGGALFLHLQGQAVKEDLLLDPEDGGTMLLRNVNNYFPIDTA